MLAVLMIDEVQNYMNRKHFNRLLADRSVNLLVLDAGVIRSNGFSIQFDEKQGMNVLVTLLT